MTRRLEGGGTSRPRGLDNYPGESVALPVKSLLKPRFFGVALLLAGVLSVASVTAARAADRVVPGAADVARLFDQATFGPTPALLAHARALGTKAWVEEQLRAPPTLYSGFPVEPARQRPGCNNWPAATRLELRCYRDTYTLFQIERQFFLHALNGPDQLRQRVALALSEIFVATNHDYPAYAMASYQNLLRRDAFGNFRTLLEDVTTHPVMGRTLDVVNNSRAHPNENYAREILQLFSIGLVELTPQGQPRAGKGGAPRATYGQATVEDLARVFTGWTYAPMPGRPLTWAGEPRYDVAMVPVESEHDTRPKRLLPGCADLPAGQGTRADLAATLDCIAGHPNVGPFLGRHLIQALVTSNPSPAYVGRVSAVFADNGAGQRGDLAAVVRAILLDPEARGDTPPPGFTVRTGVPNGYIRAGITNYELRIG